MSKPSPKKILPKPRKNPETLQEIIKKVNEQYATTFRKLAEFEEAEKSKK